MLDGGVSQDTEGDGKLSIKQLNSGALFILDVILVVDPRLGAVPDQDWNNTTS